MFGTGAGLKPSHADVKVLQKSAGRNGAFVSICFLARTA